MIALSIRQPWAWLIVQGLKDVENRDWHTPYRGQFLVHASKTCKPEDYDAAMLFIETFVNPSLVHQVPDRHELEYGGIVGVATLVDCVKECASPWFTGGEANGGGFGFALMQARAVPLTPYRGRLGFFNVDLAKSGVVL